MKVDADATASRLDALKHRPSITADALDGGGFEDEPMSPEKRWEMINKVSR